MHARDDATLGRILGDPEAIEALGRAEANATQACEVAARQRVHAALTLLPYAGTQEVFDALFTLAFLPPADGGGS